MTKQFELALLGGKPVRTKEFRSKPFITDASIEKVVSLLREGRLSRFIGSPVPGSKDIIGLKSQEANRINYEFSVLGGKSVRQFENFWSEIHKVDYSISVNSATSGLTTAILSLDIEPGEEIICSPFSFTASATSIIAANAVPVFADIDIDTFCLSPISASKSISQSTKAILPIHWNSNAGDLNSILTLARENDLKVLEDASQSPGMVYNGKHLGTHGDVGVFSLNEPKNLMTGEGGMIVTDDKNIALKSRLIRNHGESIIEKNSTNEILTNCIGYNFRMLELLAEIGCEQLRNIDFLNNIRKENYKFLIKELSRNFGEFLIPQKITHPESYFPYTVGFRWLNEKTKIHRDTVAKILRSEGIPVATGVSRLMSDNPMFQKKIAFGKNGFPFNFNKNDSHRVYSVPKMPNARKLQDEEYLGFFQIGWPNTYDDMNDIVTCFNKIMVNKNRLTDYKSNIRNNSFLSGR